MKSKSAAKQSGKKQNTDDPLHNTVRAAWVHLHVALFFNKKSIFEREVPQNVLSGHFAQEAAGDAYQSKEVKLACTLARTWSHLHETETRGWRRENEHYSDMTV